MEEHEELNENGNSMDAGSSGPNRWLVIAIVVLLGVGGVALGYGYRQQMLVGHLTAQQTVASSRAEMGVADAFYNLGRLGEAYDTYTDVQNTYAGKLGPVEKGLVTKRLK